MTAQTDPYVRVYYRAIDDPKFLAVWDDDKRLATWLRLLMTADATYPAPAPLPHGVNRAALAHLVDVRLVDLMPGSRYRMHGMVSERGKRSDQARAAANARYGRDAQGNATGVLPQSVSSAGAEQRAVRPHLHSETAETAKPIRDETPRALLSGLFEELTGRPYALPPHGKHAENLSRWVEKEGWPAVETAARLAAEDLGSYPEVGQLVFSIDAILHPPLAARGVSAKDAAAKADAESEQRERKKRLRSTAEHVAWLDAEKAKAASDAA